MDCFSGEGLGADLTAAFPGGLLQLRLAEVGVWRDLAVVAAGRYFFFVLLLLLMSYRGLSS